MRFFITTNFLILAFTSIFQSATATELTDQADRINYAIGHQIGNDFKRQKILLNEQVLQQGIQDGQNMAPPLLDKKQMNKTLLELKKNITSKMKNEAAARIEKRREDEKQKRDTGTAFMLQNQQNEDIKTMPSGLQYRVLKKGKGLKPKPDDTITFHYRAKTLDGREYDSSYKKGKPAVYRADGVLPGFTEAIQMMQPGAKWELFLPPEMAYGRQGPLAHQTIIIETDLLSIKK